MWKKKNKPMFTITSSKLIWPQKLFSLIPINKIWNWCGESTHSGKHCITAYTNINCKLKFGHHKRKTEDEIGRASCRERV